MLLNPRVCAILSFRDGKQEEPMKNILLPYVDSFTINKSADDMATKGTIKFSRNLSYSGPMTNRPTFTTDLSSLYTTKTDFVGPTNFYTDLQTIKSGMQIWNSNKSKVLQGLTNDVSFWIDVKDRNYKIASSELFRFGGLNKTYYGRLFTNVGYTIPNFDDLMTFKIDGKVPEVLLPNISKVPPNSDTDIINLFKIGDLITLRYGYVTVEPFDKRVKENLSDLTTQSFYITNLIAEETSITLELEGWTWMLRQVPARLSIEKDMKLIDFLSDYIFPVILNNTYIKSIITRDAETSGAHLQERLYGSFPTENLIKNLIGPLRITITNMYDLLITLRDTYFITFNDTKWAGPAGLSLSFGYGFRRPEDLGNKEAQTISNIINQNTTPSGQLGAATTQKVASLTTPGLNYNYLSFKDFKSKDLTKLNYSSYAVLVRITSNNSIQKQVKNKVIQASNITKQADGSYKLKTNNNDEIQVVYGDPRTMGMIENPQDTIKGRSIIRTSDNDNANIVNIKLVGITDKNYLAKLAKITYNKLKFATPLNAITVKPYRATGQIPSIYDFVRIQDINDEDVTGDYIVVNQTISMDADSGFDLTLNLGVRFLTRDKTGQAWDDAYYFFDENK